MKKLLILSIAFFSLLSCSSNEENLDPFIGTWHFFSIDNKEVNDCLKKNTFIILENGNATYLDHDSKDNGDCIPYEIKKSTWKNKGGGNYALIGEGETEESIQKVTFSNNNNTWSITEKADSGEGKVIMYKRK